jgi:hypothetical protein
MRDADPLSGIQVETGKGSAHGLRLVAARLLVADRLPLSSKRLVHKDLERHLASRLPN